ncbi:MAG: hypothetical protein JWM16_1532 [Verrucomicrobiales bacterium]|nr:hypothetical protein [Verrucomicrobiales bacterium]
MTVVLSCTFLYLILISLQAVLAAEDPMTAFGMSVMVKVGVC